MKKKEIIVIFGIVLSCLLLVVSMIMTFLLFFLPKFTENTRTIFKDIFSTDEGQNTWGIISLISIMIFCFIAMKLRDLYWNMTEDSVTKIFRQILLSHFKPGKKRTNNQLGNVLDYLFEAIKSINNEGDLRIFKCNWLEIEKIIETWFHLYRGDLLIKAEKINNHILLLEIDSMLFHSQRGFQDFFEKEYEKPYKEGLSLKEKISGFDSHQSVPHKKANPWMN